jgi:hypothetical protein
VTAILWWSFAALVSSVSAGTAAVAQTNQDVYAAMKNMAEKECHDWTEKQFQSVASSIPGPHAQEDFKLGLEGQCHGVEDSAIDQLDDLRVTGKVNADKFRACTQAVRSTASGQLFFTRILCCVTAH